MYEKGYSTSEIESAEKLIEMILGSEEDTQVPMGKDEESVPKFDVNEFYNLFGGNPQKTEDELDTPDNKPCATTGEHYNIEHLDNGDATLTINVIGHPKETLYVTTKNKVLHVKSKYNLRPFDIFMFPVDFEFALEDIYNPENIEAEYDGCGILTINVFKLHSVDGTERSFEIY